MYMYYWFGTKLQNFLFYGYNIITTYGLISTCLGLSALAILYEAMKLIQIRLQEITKEHNQVTKPTQNMDSSSLISETSDKTIKAYSLSHCCTWMKWILELFHRCIHVMLGYFLMLAIMTFNGYINVAIVLGSGIGYYIFGLILLKINLAKIKKHHRLAQCNPVCADAIISDRRESAISIISENVEPESNVNIDVDVHIKAES
ncbi:PREDICTED: probable low affinity copper uptake protein 2 [Ceratosolen solmsi marchali]|uniref:Copper transport protein n=1 Tax=Ceratosolen solmsi marchali TaxID=326594 RepID=A0AAJ6YXQ7_9HYME|nr:PREDICTED: probable low affinity copper uptake protein 2 [Ceratosolen solmsi marchali]XP_011506339.1 PREDICTED: probable low affinity copper uptake protein 2 [Ceratosolen solmsi marchali]XP_011506340.1 PREDICTED: probable low affinity copper uptake protein 2 [Ceratosolen solmsi marchali]